MRPTLLRMTLCLCALVTVLMVGPVAAQDRPAPAAELAAGWVGFADDGIVSKRR